MASLATSPPAPKLAIAEKMSGAPLPKATSVTPTTFSESFSWEEIFVRLGTKKASATTRDKKKERKEKEKKKRR